MGTHPVATSSKPRSRTIPSATSGTSKPSSASEAHAAARKSGARGASHRQRVLIRVRIGITMFVLALLTMVTLGWIWTASHQPPPLRMASHIVLAVAAIAGVFALTRIWRRDPPVVPPGR